MIDHLKSSLYTTEKNHRVSARTYAATSVNAYLNCTNLCKLLVVDTKLHETFNTPDKTELPSQLVRKTGDRFVYYQVMSRMIGKSQEIDQSIKSP